jgi:hypothetical protein
MEARVMPSSIGDQISSFVHDFFGINPGPPGEPPGPAISEFVIANTPPNPIRPPEVPPNPIAPGPVISDFVHDLGVNPGPPGEPPGPAISEFAIAHTPPSPIRPPSPETNPAVPILDVQFGDTGGLVRGTNPHFEDFFPPGIVTATAELPAVQLPREVPPSPVLPPSPVFETNPAVPILEVLFGDPGLPGGTAVVGLAASDDWLVV